MSYTANPRHPDNHPASADPGVPAEAPGAIASDSLAAESLKTGGDFAAKNEHAAPLGVSGSKSTLNTTDTSGASSLPPADDGTERARKQALGHNPDEKGPSGLKYPHALGGQTSEHGLHSDTGEYVGGGGAARQQNSSSGGPAYAAGASDFGATTSSDSGPDPSKISSGAAAVSSSSSSSQQQSSSASRTTAPSTATHGDATVPASANPDASAAPNYAARVSGAISNTDNLKPKGANLTEGGDVPANRSTFTGDVGGPKDPGRLAERAFEGINANVAGGGTSRDKEGQRGGLGGFENLGANDQA